MSYRLFVFEVYVKIVSSYKTKFGVPLCVPSKGMRLSIFCLFYRSVVETCLSIKASDRHWWHYYGACRTIHIYRSISEQIQNLCRMLDINFHHMVQKLRQT